MAGQSRRVAPIGSTASRRAQAPGGAERHHDDSGRILGTAAQEMVTAIQTAADALFVGSSFRNYSPRREGATAEVRQGPSRLAQGSLALPPSLREIRVIRGRPPPAANSGFRGIWIALRVHEQRGAPQVVFAPDSRR